MAWEEIYRGRKPCPCGKGEYEEVHRQNDWLQHEERREMLCPDCRDRYTYSTQVIGGHRWNEIERGWTLKSVLEAEDTYHVLLRDRLRGAYLDVWRERFAGAHTKKQVWDILTMHGKYYPSLGAFYRHTRGVDGAHLMDIVVREFDHAGPGRIFAMCGVAPNWEALGIVTGDVCELCGAGMTRDFRNGMWVCGQCGYRRPLLDENSA